MDVVRGLVIYDEEEEDAVDEDDGYVEGISVL